jgi:N-acetylneuraminate synthase
MQIKIGSKIIGDNHPTYFIADIAANHDGSLERAKELIKLAAAAGADAAKFQNFTAASIVSEIGFAAMGKKIGHQAGWGESVFDVYRKASIPLSWTPELKETCEQSGIDYFSAAYDFEALNYLEPFVPAYKIGSGDITWHEIVESTAKKGKPVLIATGASTLEEVRQALEIIERHNSQIVLMQCNTNYTASLDNFRYQNLRALTQFGTLFPKVVLGLSDHTFGHTSVLGAISLGAKAVEKHFTDDTSRSGPDHAFSMDPASWSAMVHDARELEASLGDGFKKLEENEIEAVIVQRRALRAARVIGVGEVLSRDDITVLRPAPLGSLGADQVLQVVGKTAKRGFHEGELLLASDFA